ncbi:hypothetical protein PsexTeo8_19320 [Pseudomonas extremaustralis]|uniref:hypothetical protein n=1 Tax=Pseudomonas extremaustralis TaxID=359110 RepID=UPI002AA0CB01|nr:hypothetical protein [Pseudomonas extremaustralis]MDY7065496.1 hypothetical protein [Pseudomonas extremaustralis]
MTRSCSLLVLLCGTVVGCTTSLTHQKLETGAQPDSPGFSYYLPRQRFIVTATYELRNCPNPRGSEEEKSAPLEVTQSATVTEAPIADHREYYSVPLDTLSSGWKTTTLTATFYENQTLHTFGATADDRTGAVIKGVLAAAVSVAKIQTGTFTAAAEKPICHDTIYDALKTVQDGDKALLSDKLDEKGRASKVAVVTAARSILKITESYVFDPSLDNLEQRNDPQRSRLVAWFANPSTIAAAGKDNAAWYARTLRTGIQLVGAPTKVDPPAKSLDGQGVIYREPMPVQVKICAGKCSEPEAETIALYDSQVTQFGRYVVLPLQNGAFEKNNLSLSFAANGRLESVTYGSESKLEKMAASASETATTIEGYKEKRAAAEQAESMAKAGAPLQNLKVEIEMLKAKADKIEAERRLTELGGQ